MEHKNVCLMAIKLFVTAPVCSYLCSQLFIMALWLILET